MSAAAAGRVYKKRRYNPTVKGSKFRKLISKVTRNPYSDSTPHYFKRMMQQVMITTGNAGQLQITSDSAQDWCTGGNQAGDLAIIGAGTTQFALACCVKLKELVNYTDYTDLFNQYRIEKLVLTIELICGPSYNGGAGSVLPTIYSRYDPNDRTLPSNWTDIAQSGNCRSYNFSNGDTHTLVCVPRPATPQYVAGVAAGYGLPSKTKYFWMDTTSPSDGIEHYAFKMFVRNFTVPQGSGLALRITPMVYFATCRTR